MSRKTVFSLLAVLTIVSVLAACGPTPAPQVVEMTVVVPEEVTVVVTEKETVVVTEEKVVKEEVEVVITATPVVEPKELRIGIATEPWDMDPAIRTDTGSGYVIANVYDPLVALDQNNEPTCDMALCTEWEIMDDATKIVVKIQGGVKFHDGSDLTAADVKYSIDWQLDEENAAPNAALLGPISAVNVIDDTTIEVLFEAPYTTVLHQWARVLDGIVPEDAHGERSEEKGVAGFAGSDLSREPIGSGPFKFVEWVSGSHITVEPFEDYWIEGVPAPGIDRVVFEVIEDPAAMLAALVADSIQIVDKVPFRDFSTIQQMPGIETARIPGVQTQYVATNLGAPPFGISADQVGDEAAMERALNLRKFLYHAIDREEISDEIFYGMATVQYGPWYPDSEWFNPELLDRPLYDPALAQEYLDKAGPEYAGGFDFRMICTNAQWFCDVSTIIQEQLRPYGVNVEVISIDKAAFFDTLYETFDWETGMEDWGLSNMIAQSWLWSGWYRNNHNHNHWHHAAEDLPEGFHDTDFGHAEFTALWDQVNVEPDDQTRKDMVYELQTMIVDNVVRINLMFLDNLYAWRDSVEGYGDGLNSMGEINLRFVTAFAD